MKLADSIRDFTAFVEGQGYAGEVEEGTLPVVDFVTQEMSGGGLGGTIDVPMGKVAKLETALKFKGLNPVLLGQVGKEDGLITLRGHLSDGDRQGSAIAEMRGFFKRTNAGTMGSSDQMVELGATLSYYKLTIYGEVVYDIDIINKRCVILGVDRWADYRASLGI